MSSIKSYTATLTASEIGGLLNVPTRYLPGGKRYGWTVHVYEKSPPPAFTTPGRSGIPNLKPAKNSPKNSGGN